MILDSAARIQEYTEKGWWGTDTLYDLFARNAAATPDAVAVVDPPNRAEIAVGEPSRLTYRELRRAEERLATTLIEAGVARDDIVMVQLPNVVELVAIYLAAARIGAILSPVPVQYRAHELRRAMRVVEPLAFVSTTHCAGFDAIRVARELQADVPGLQTIVAIDREAPPGVLTLRALGGGSDHDRRPEADLARAPVTANDIVTICWTSGTEAEPRAVPRSHNQWIWIGYASVDGCELAAGCSLLNPFPLVNMAGIGGMLVPWLLTGGKLALHHPLNLPLFLEQIRAERASYTAVPPALLNLLLAQPALLDAADLSSLNAIGSGAAPLSPWMVSQYQERHGIPIVNLFGSNEGASFTSGPRELPDPADRATFFPRFGVPGHAWRSRIAAQMSTRLVDPPTRKTIVEPGVPGELAIKSPGIFPGYYRRPDLNEKVLDRDGYYYTGDLFEIAGRADCYRFVGRLNDLINRGGVKISPEEIEALILEHPAVADVAVVGYPDPILGERLCAVVVPKQKQTVRLEAIRELLAARDVARYKLPERLEVVAGLPRNPGGKVLRHAVKEGIRMAGE